MKSLLLLSFIICCFTANAKNYYISNYGNDNNSGSSPNDPWQTLNKLNSFKGLNPGDAVFFRRGDTFYGQLSISNSGNSSNPILFSAYGTGAKPVITGFTTVSNWTNLGGNIWESTDAVSSLSATNMVVVNGVNTQMGRYPNSGYLTYKSHVGKSLITDNDGLTGSINWTGAELAMYVTTYEVERNPIIAQWGGTLSYKAATDINIQYDNEKYIIQNDPRTLDAANEWYYNPSTKKIRIYSTGWPADVRMATTDILLNLDGLNSSNYGYITIDNIAVQGSNKISALVRNAKHVTIQNCDFDHSGGDAINGPYWGNSTGLTIQGCTFNNSNNGAIKITSDFDNALIRNNVIKNTALLPGMCNSGDNNSLGIYAIGESNIIEYNTIENTGYIGIRFDKNYTVVRNNFVNNFLLVKTDGAGIYTWNGSGANRPVFVGRKVLNNIVLNGLTSSGIYMDDGSQGVEVAGNTIANCKWGLYIHGNQNMDVHDNTVYNCLTTQLLLVSEINEEIRNVAINNNIFFSKNESQLNLLFQTKWDDVRLFGTANNNYYVRPIDDNMVFNVNLNGTSWPPDVYNLATWQNYVGQDINSKKSPKTIPHFTVNSLIGSNKYPFGDFEQYNYLPGVTSQADNGNASVTLDNTGRVDGRNSLGVSYKGNGKNTTEEVRINDLGLVSAGKKYVLKFSSLGATSDDRIIGVYLRMPNNPWALLAPVQNLTISGNKTETEVLFTPSITESNAFLSFKLLGKDGDVWLDNIQFYEADANLVNPDDYLRFEYNGTTESKTVALNANYIDAKGTAYNGAITLAPFTSAVLIKNGVTTVAPNQSITANAGEDQTITLPTNSANLSGSGTGVIKSYQWRQLSGPSVVMTAVDNASATVTGLYQGAYQFELKVTGNEATVRDTMQIMVNTTNSNSNNTSDNDNNVPLSVNAGADQTITLPVNSVNLSGNGTGPISAYQWRQLSGPSIVMSAVDNAAATVLGLYQGVYQFELKVVDSRNISKRDTMQVTVFDIQNLKANPLSVDAGADQTITLPTNRVNLSGSGSGPVGAYQWRQLSGPSIVMTTVDNASATVLGLYQGVYQFELKVSDSRNMNISQRDIMTVTVNTPNYNYATKTAPQLTNTGQGQTMVAPSSTNTFKSATSSAIPKSEVNNDSIRSVTAPDVIGNPINNNVLQLSSFRIYPNPVQDIATLEINVTEPNSNLLIIISDMKGTTVYKKEISAGYGIATERINMTNFTSGIYSITAELNGKESQTLKVAKL